MSIRALLVSAAVAVMLSSGQAQAQSQAPGGGTGHLSLPKVEAIFNQLKAKGVDLSGSLPWCYFFLSYDRAKLDDASKTLATQGYSVVDMQSLPNALPDGPRVWQLQVRRVEHLTPESVVARDQALTAFAEKVGSIYFDGLEVDPGKEPAPSQP